MKAFRLSFVAAITLMLSGCFDFGASGFQDLDQYLEDMRARPTGNIEPLPAFRSYEAFTYGASAKRSPFEPPVKIAISEDQLNSNIKPDSNRVKEYLEQFEVDSFSMVGSISNDEGLWGLIRGENGINRIRVGDYLGRNHGRIVFIDDSEIRLLEIVPAGPGFWIERPRALRLSE